ncbi:MAG: hypothetical protein IJ519_05800 [Clostridia bacterium]|nr:hypothetical protein [Clostridia bacterium]
MKYIILLFLTLTVLFTSCGNVDDTDGKIGNEQKETENTENIKDKAEEMMTDASEKVEDMTDKMSDVTGAVSGGVTGIKRLTTEQAQSAALTDAGCSTREATFYKTYLRSESGRVYYDVEFAVGEKMYDYEIDSLTGNVLKREESAIK